MPKRKPSFYRGPFPYCYYGFSNTSLDILNVKTNITVTLVSVSDGDLWKNCRRSIGNMSLRGDIGLEVSLGRKIF